MYQASHLGPIKDPGISRGQGQVSLIEIDLSRPPQPVRLRLCSSLVHVFWKSPIQTKLEGEGVQSQRWVLRGDGVFLGPE